MSLAPSAREPFTSCTYHLSPHYCALCDPSLPLYPCYFPFGRCPLLFPHAHIYFSRPCSSVSSPKKRQPVCSTPLTKISLLPINNVAGLVRYSCFLLVPTPSHSTQPLLPVPLQPSSAGSAWGWGPQSGGASVSSWMWPLSNPVLGTGFFRASCSPSIPVSVAGTY